MEQINLRDSNGCSRVVLMAHDTLGLVGVYNAAGDGVELKADDHGSTSIVFRRKDGTQAFVVVSAPGRTSILAGANDGKPCLEMSYATDTMEAVMIKRDGEGRVVTRISVP